MVEVLTIVLGCDPANAAIQLWARSQNVGFPNKTHSWSLFQSKDEPEGEGLESGGGKLLSGLDSEKI